MVEYYDVARAIQADRRAKALSSSYALTDMNSRSWGSWLSSLFSKTEVAMPSQEWAPEHKVPVGQYR